MNGFMKKVSCGTPKLKTLLTCAWFFFTLELHLLLVGCVWGCLSASHGWSLSAEALCEPCSGASAGIIVDGSTFCLTCSSDGSAAGLMVMWSNAQGSMVQFWAVSEEEGAFGPGYHRHLPRWAERGLGKPPFACHASKCLLQCQVGWLGGQIHRKVPQGWVASQRDFSAETLQARREWHAIWNRRTFNKESSTQQGYYSEFVAGSHKCPTSWAEGRLLKCCPPALSPAERALSKPHPSGTPPTAG